MPVAPALAVLTVVSTAIVLADGYLANYKAGDFMLQPTLEDVLVDLRRQYESPASDASSATAEGTRKRRQTPSGKGPSAVFPEISFRDMASVVAEATKAVDARFEVRVALVCMFAKDTLTTSFPGGGGKSISFSKSWLFTYASFEPKAPLVQMQPIIRRILLPHLSVPHSTC